VDLIAQFIARYRREFDFYERAGRLVAQQLDARLQASGIRAMVTSRAKNPRRLEAKLRQRAGERPYETIDTMYADIVDLAGVRVALYFPGERTEVDKVIREQFVLTSPPKEFTGTSNPTYKKRFSGYWATHYRLQLRESVLPEADQRYSDARVEVQVASVLMHAWAEVEHDLVYKPLQGNLSEDELAILDELNGMVLTGEIALERLQRAAEVRVKGSGARFENHYDLASFLLEATRPMLQGSATEPVLGDVELLFRFLAQLEIMTPEALRPYLESLSPDTERRPVAQQITDQVLAADPQRYVVYAAIRSDTASTEIGELVADYTNHQQAYLERAHAALGYFLALWIKFEYFLRELTTQRGTDSKGAAIPSSKVLRKLEVFTDSELAEIEQIRRIRNYLVHGIDEPDLDFVQESGAALRRIMDRLAVDPRPDVRRAAERALGFDV
jgi:ppGpp synthetase/RelA/SpoT-type nucleotidyltranferase